MPAAVNFSVVALPNQKVMANAVHDFLNVHVLPAPEDLQRQRTPLLRLPVLLLQILLSPARRIQNPGR